MTEQAWKARLQDRMSILGLTMKSLSQAAGLGETGVRDMLKRTHSPSIDTVAEVAKVLGMTLSELYEGTSGAQRCPSLLLVNLIGATTGEPNSPWFELSGNHSVVIDETGASVSVPQAATLIGLYHRDNIVIFEKSHSITKPQLISDRQFLIFTKDKRRYFAHIEFDDPDGLVVLLPEEHLVIEFSDIEWIAKWRYSFPRLRIEK